MSVAGGWRPLAQATEPSLFGGKAGGLARAIQSGLRVPPGFVLEAVEGMPDLPPLPAGLLALVGEGELAVRSSAVGEDGAADSHAGMHLTVLHVRGVEALREAVQACRGSVETERAKAYRAARSLPRPAMAVVVQRFIAAEWAGVAFGADPVTGSRAYRVVEAVRGDGEALVSGVAAPKRAQTDAAGRTIERDPVLPQEVVAAVVALLAATERAFDDAAMDIEWAWDGLQLHLLQARPITTRASDAGPRTLWSNSNAAELVPGLLPPLSFDLLQRYVAALLQPVVSRTGFDVVEARIVGRVHGRLYFRVNALLGWVRTVPLLSQVSPALFARLLGGDEEGMAAGLALLRPSDLPRPKTGLLPLLFGGLGFNLGALRHLGQDGASTIAALARENARDASLDLSALSDAALLAQIERLSRTLFGVERDDAAMLASVGGFIGQLLLQTLAVPLFGAPSSGDGLAPMRARGGLASADFGHALAALAAQARREGLGEALAGPASELDQRIGSRGGGPALIAAWLSLLGRYGHRAPGEVDVARPRWIEQPDALLRQAHALATQREPVTRAAPVPAWVARLGPLRRWLLERLVRIAVAGAAARENLKDVAIARLGLVRKALLEVGRRGVAIGRLASAEEVFLLRFEELPVACSGEGAPFELALRSAEMERHARTVAPDVVMEGAVLPPRSGPPPQAEARRLVGLAASPGVVEGWVVVVEHPLDPPPFAPGEVLVAPCTDPGWTPLMLAAGAIVTDVGGVLSHGAIVARELGVPAVVNTGSATTRLRTGMRVRVDGTRGVVELLEG